MLVLCEHIDDLKNNKRTLKSYYYNLICKIPYMSKSSKIKKLTCEILDFKNK